MRRELKRLGEDLEKIDGDCSNGKIWTELGNFILFRLKLFTDSVEMDVLTMLRWTQLCARIAERTVKTYYASTEIFITLIISPVAHCPFRCSRRVRSPNLQSPSSSNDRLEFSNPMSKLEVSRRDYKRGIALESPEDCSPPIY